MGDIGGIFGLIGLACGIYIFYACFQMKMKGEINTNILIPKSIDPGKCRDKEAYLKEAMPKMILLGITATVYGAADLLNTYVIEIGIVLPITMIIAVVVLIWFAIVISKMNKKYF